MSSLSSDCLIFSSKLLLKSSNFVSVIFIAQMKLRHKLLKENYNQVFVTNEDDSIKAAKQELLEMVVDHLPKHFPDKFESKEGGIYNKMGNICFECGIFLWENTFLFKTSYQINKL